MLNEEKTKLNVQKSIYERGEGNMPLRLREFFKNPKFDRSKAFNVVCGIISYVLIAAIIYVGGGSIWIDFKTNTLASILIIVGFAALGVMLVAIYARLVSRILKKRYEDIRSNLARYEMLEEKLK